jgi:hypothetical protein
MQRIATHIREQMLLTTVVQSLIKEPSGKRAVIVFRAPFLVTFLEKQKSDKQNCDTSK